MRSQAKIYTHEQATHCEEESEIKQMPRKLEIIITEALK